LGELHYEKKFFFSNVNKFPIHFGTFHQRPKGAEKMTTIPFVISERDGRERQFDIFSLLLRDRIIFINGVIDDLTANSVVAQLLYLDADDPEKEISLYINSPGGSVSAGLAIYDTMRHIKAPVHTIGIGLAASMGSLLLAGGNRRSVLPHTKVMIHQPLVGGLPGGRETDISIIARDLSDTRSVIAEILAKHTGKSEKAIGKAIENDRYMNAQQAVEFGLCDSIVEIA